MKNILFMTTILIGCSKVPISTAPQISIEKQGFVTKALGETTPIVFNNNTYIISFGINSVTEVRSVQIQSFPDFSVVSTTPFPYAYGCAIVVGSTVYIFGSSIGSDGLTTSGNSIGMSSSTDLVNWAQPQVIFTGLSYQSIYNTSVAQDSTGFILTYEIHEDGNPSWFYERFAHSTDMVYWNTIGGFYAPNNESACPTIRYMNGKYYLFITGDNGAKTGPRYTTSMTTSLDLISFTPQVLVLSSTGNTDEGNDNSDIDFTSYGNQVLITYGVGNQVTWGAVKYAYFNGTLEEFLKEFE